MNRQTRLKFTEGGKAREVRPPEEVVKAVRAASQHDRLLRRVRREFDRCLKDARWKRTVYKDEDVKLIPSATTGNNPADNTLVGYGGPPVEDDDRSDVLDSYFDQWNGRPVYPQSAPWILTKAGRAKVLNGTPLLHTDIYKVALFRSDSNIAPDSASYLDLTNEHPNANGYLTGGVRVGLEREGCAIRATNSVEWTASGGSITARFAVIYEVSGDVLCYCLLDSTPADVTVMDGANLKVVCGEIVTLENLEDEARRNMQDLVKALEAGYGIPPELVDWQASPNRATVAETSQLFREAVQKHTPSGYGTTQKGCGGPCCQGPEDDDD